MKRLFIYGKKLVLQSGIKPVWIHGDFAIGNILMNEYKLSAVIDFEGCANWRS